MFEVSEKWIRQWQSGTGGWNREQLECLGLKWPPSQGWIKRSEGLRISLAAKSRFESLRGRKKRDRFQDSLF